SRRRRLPPRDVLARRRRQRRRGADPGARDPRRPALALGPPRVADALLPAAPQSATLARDRGLGWTPGRRHPLPGRLLHPARLRLDAAPLLARTRARAPAHHDPVR